MQTDHDAVTRDPTISASPRFDRTVAMATYICSLPNEKRAGRIPELISDDPAAIEQFAKKWDRPGRGVFECVSPLRESARRRALETVAALTQLHVDIDVRKLTNSREEVLRQAATAAAAPGDPRKRRRLPCRGATQGAGTGKNAGVCQPQ